jgi:nicotinamidase-related amidase
MVLLVVDTQSLIMSEELYNFYEFKNKVKSLLAAAREYGVEVIFVRHNDGEDGELVKGTDGFEIYEEFSPLPGEMIFDKTVNSAFKDTGLLVYLKEKKIQTVMVVGLQTDYCMDAAVKCGFEHGFQMIVPDNTNSTVDNPFMTAEQCYKFYNEFMWKDRYAECITVAETISRMKEYHF